MLHISPVLIGQHLLTIPKVVWPIDALGKDICPCPTYALPRSDAPRHPTSLGSTVGDVSTGGGGHGGGSSATSPLSLHFMDLQWRPPLRTDDALLRQQW
ncbi:hypothetical protein Syun_012107 [Stephania yunnanensis]|uniref:Uncharacterized protein n=1 Tax=Stephania yunnanensis TaxID=152371 RepID=A0AAP0JYZ4_9MAGN